MIDPNATSNQQQQDDPNQPQAPAVQDVAPPTALPTLPAPTAVQPTLAPQQNPNAPHPLSRALDAVLKSATGGDVYYTDPQGNRKLAPQSRGTLGKTLIAATLAGLLSKDEYRPTPYGPVRDFTGTAANAAQASQAKINEMRNRPQQMSDDEQTRRLLTIQNNAKLLTLQSQSAHAQHAMLQDNLDNAKTFLAPFDEYEGQRTADQPSAYLKRGLTAEQVTAPGSGVKLTDSNVVLDGSQMVYNPETKQTEEHPLYAVLNPDLKDVALPKEVTDKLAEINSQYADIHKVTGGNVRIPIAAYVSAMHDYQTVTQGEHTLKTLASEIGGNSDFNLATAIRGNRQLLAAVNPLIQAGAGGNLPDQRPDNLLHTLLTSPNGTEILKLIGLTPQQADAKMQAIANERTRQAKLAAEGGLGDKAPAPPQMVTELTATANRLPKDQRDAIMAGVNPNGLTVGEVEKLKDKVLDSVNKNREAAQKNANPDDVKILAEQLLQPNNLSTMKDIGGRGNQRTQILAEAARMAKERGIPFDIGLVNQRTKFLGEYEDPKGRAATNRQAINNVLQHAGDLSDLNEANRRSDVKILNTPINKLKDQFGDATFTQYQTASGVLKDELSLYFAGGYAPSKDQQEMWNKIQSDTATPAQTEAFAKEVVRLAARRANTFNQQFRTNMGYDDPNMITPAAKAAAEHLGMGNEIAQFGSGGQLGQKSAPQSAPPSRVVPAGAIPGRDANGNIIGYKTADGKVVKF